MKNAVVYRYLCNAVERQQKELAGELQIIKTRAWIRLTDLHPAYSLHSPSLSHAALFLLSTFSCAFGILS